MRANPLQPRASTQLLQRARHARAPSRTRLPRTHPECMRRLHAADRSHVKGLFWHPGTPHARARENRTSSSYMHARHTPHGRTTHSLGAAYLSAHDGPLQRIHRGLPRVGRVSVQRAQDTFDPGAVGAGLVAQPAQLPRGHERGATGPGRTEERGVRGLWSSHVCRAPGCMQPASRAWHPPSLLSPSRARTHRIHCARRRRLSRRQRIRASAAAIVFPAVVSLWGRALALPAAPAPPPAT
jgi:hypothetical protein